MNIHHIQINTKDFFLNQCEQPPSNPEVAILKTYNIITDHIPLIMNILIF